MQCCKPVATINGFQTGLFFYPIRVKDREAIRISLAHFPIVSKSWTPSHESFSFHCIGIIRIEPRLFQNDSIHNSAARWII